MNHTTCMIIPIGILVHVLLSNCCCERRQMTTITQTISKLQQLYLRLSVIPMSHFSEKAGPSKNNAGSATSSVNVLLLSDGPLTNEPTHSDSKKCCSPQSEIAFLASDHSSGFPHLLHQGTNTGKGLADKELDGYTL